MNTTHPTQLWRRVGRSVPRWARRSVPSGAGEQLGSQRGRSGAPRAPGEASPRLGSRGSALGPARLVALTVVISIAVVVTAGLLSLVVLRPRLVEREVASARAAVVEDTRRSIEPAITTGVLAADPAALATFDEIVRREAARSDTAGLTLWTAGGDVAYSLDDRLIGEQFLLPPGAAAALAEGRVQAEAKALDGPQHELERDDEPTPAIEVFVPVRGPAGEALVWEVELHRDGITDRAGSLLTTLAVGEALSATVVIAMQGLFALTLARRHSRERRYRSWLLHRLEEAGRNEGRRIAADLHDGVVQDLAAIALDLEVPRDGMDGDEREELAGRVRAAIGSLRNQAANISPADLSRPDIAGALGELLTRLAPTPTTRLDVDPDAIVPAEFRWLVYRVAQEALRNVKRHADASTTVLSLHGAPVALAVSDDGIGFDPEVDPIQPGHLGLALLADLAVAGGATLTVRSAPGRGTTVRLEVPG